MTVDTNEHFCYYGGKTTCTVVEEYFLQKFRDMHLMQKNNQLCDAVLIFDDGERIGIHKIVLAASSRMLKGRFVNGAGVAVTIHGIDSSIGKLLINYAYCFSIKIEDYQLDDIQEAASQLGFLEVQRICKERKSRLPSHPRNNLITEIQDEINENSLSGEGHNSMSNFKLVQAKSERHSEQIPEFQEVQEKVGANPAPNIVTPKEIVQTKPAIDLTPVMLIGTVSAVAVELPQNVPKRQNKKQITKPLETGTYEANANSAEKLLQNVPKRQNIKQITKPLETSTYEAIANSAEELPQNVPKRENIKQITKPLETSTFEAVANSVEELPNIWPKEPKEKRKIKCGKCNKILWGSYFNFKAHLEQVHEGKKFSCTECSIKFTRRAYLNAHFRSVHKGDRETCSICQKSFHDAFTLKKHVKTVHQANEIFECQQCDKKYRRIDSLRNHIALEHDNAPRFTCPICSKGFMSPKDKNNHYENVHLRKASGKSTCPECDLTVTTRHLAKHIITMHKKEKLKCSECLSLFCDKKSLDRHFDVVHDKRRFRCTICLAEYRDYKSWLRHHETKHVGSSFPCKHRDCAATFVTKGSLKRHTESAHDKVTHPCTSCDHVTSSKVLLTNI